MPTTRPPLPHRTKEPDPYEAGESDLAYFLFGTFLMTLSIIAAIITVWWLGEWVFS